MAENGHETIGLDIEFPKNYTDAVGYTFVKGSLEKIPFPNAHFDTVICSHVLENVPNLDVVLSELLRVTRRRLLIVLPRQRKYRYVTDLHIRFFLMNTTSEWRSRLRFEMLPF